MNLKELIKKENRIVIYGNIYNGKYTTVIKELGDIYDIIELYYIDFYYNLYEEKLKKLKNVDNFNKLFGGKEKILLIREIEIINIKKINEILKEYNNKMILIGSGDSIKSVNKLNLYKIKYDIKTNYLIENKKKYKEDNKIEIDINNNNINLELYINVNKIFNKKLDYNSIINIYNNEKILFPLLIHENYKTIIKNNISNKKEQNEIIKNVSNRISNYLKYESNILNEHKWYLYDILCLYLCEYINNQVIKEENDNYYPLEYTKILTKNSIKSKNNKNYREIFKKINIIHNFDYLLLKYINKILILKLKYNSEDFKTYLNEYGYNDKDYIKIIKNTNEYYFISDMKHIKNLI